MKGNELDGFPEQMSQRDLYHLALKYSDGLMLTPHNHDEELIAYAQQLGLPVLENVDVTAEGASALVNDFFDSIWSAGKEGDE